MHCNFAKEKPWHCLGDVVEATLPGVIIIFNMTKVVIQCQKKGLCCMLKTGLGLKTLWHVKNRLRVKAKLWYVQSRLRVKTNLSVSLSLMASRKSRMRGMRWG